jgi:hypothetical protein
MASKWSRADTISAAAMVIALVALIGPWLGHIIDVQYEPDATIVRVTISNDSCVNIQGGLSHIGFNTTGTASNIPAGEDLWLLVRSVEGPWYPLTRINTSIEPWNEQTEINTKDANFTNIEVIMLTAAEDGQLINYMTHPHTNKQHANVTISSPPSGSRTLETYPWPNWDPGICIVRS